VDGVRGRQHGAHLHRPNWPGYAVAAVADVDSNDGSGGRPPYEQLEL
jgi:hypothetical protein